MQQQNCQQLELPQDEVPSGPFPEVVKSNRHPIEGARPWKKEEPTTREVATAMGATTASERVEELAEGVAGRTATRVKCILHRDEA